MVDLRLSAWFASNAPTIVDGRRCPRAPSQPSAKAQILCDALNIAARFVAKLLGNTTGDRPAGASSGSYMRRLRIEELDGPRAAMRPRL